MIGACDGAPETEPLREKDILCLGHLQRVFGLLDALADVGTERDTAGSRELFFNDYCKLVLLHIWNPLIGSLRQLQEAVALKKVAEALGVKRFSLGSFSEAPRVFDPEKLKPVMAELAAELQPMHHDPRLDEVKHAITLVDGTVLTGLSRLARSAVGFDARYNTPRDGRAVYGWRLHTQLELKTFSPHRIDRTGTATPGTTARTTCCGAAWRLAAAMWGTGAMPTARCLMTSSMHKARMSSVPRRTRSSPWSRSGCSARRLWTRGWCSMRW